MKEKTISLKTVFQGRRVSVDVLDVEIAPGVRSTREIVRHPGACAILAQLPDGRFVLVRQYRKPVEKELVEVVAGVIDPGEDPDVCAARELKEETGYSASEIVKLGVMLVSPGYMEERLHLYFARLLPKKGARNLDDDERLDVLYFKADELEAMMKTGEIEDGKTLATWLLYKLKVAAV